MIEIKIARDFTKKPGGRYRSEGDYSGEEFREKILMPRYEEAITNGKKLIVDLNDCYGFAPSFLEEAFGGLVRLVGNKDILKILELHTEDRPGLKEKIVGYINEA